MRRGTWCCVLWCMAALTASAFAQAPAADSTAVEYFAPEGTWARAGMSFYGDVRMRWDEVRDRPGASDDLGLKRLMLRWGLIRAPVGSPLRVEFGLAGFQSGTPDPPEWNFGDPQDFSSRPWAPVLNQELNDFAIDRLVAVFSSRQQALSVSVGRQRSPLRLTEMIWDDDLRPLGLAAIARHDLTPIATARLGGAIYSDSDHLGSLGPLTTLQAVQLSALIREEGATGGDLTLSWLRFATPDLARQNEAAAFSTRPLADFDVVDLQLGARAVQAGIPVSLRLDVARNVAHPRDRDAVRVRLALGGAGVPAGAEVGWVFQRIEREAVPGAFNSDDWWFHTRMRGNQVWLRVARGGFEAKLAGFHERRDDLSRPTRRLTAELTARLPSR